MRRPLIVPLVFGVAIAIALVVPLIAFAVFTRATIESDISARVQEDRKVAARLAAAVVQQRLQSDVASLALFAARLDVFDAARRRDGQALGALVAGFASPYAFKLAGVVDPQGEVLARQPSGLVDPTFATDVAANAANLSPSEPGWMFMVPDGRAPTQLETIAVIVVPMDVGGERWAVYGLLDFRTFASVFVPVPLQSYRSIVLLDEVGQIVASAGTLVPTFGNVNDQPPFKLHSIEIPGLRQALSSDLGSETATIGGHDYLAVHTAVIPKHWVLYLLDDPAIALAGQRRLTEQLTTGAAIAAAVAVLLAGALAALIARNRRQARDIARLAVSDERLRIARDLHDLLGHSLSLIAIKSELALRLEAEGSPLARREIADVEHAAREALRDVRASVLGYRQPSLAGELAGAQSALTAAGIDCRFRDDGAKLPEEVDAVFAWTVRESVTNVIRHSGARHCDIAIAIRGDRAEIQITDDGSRAAAAIGSGSGLQGIRERAAIHRGVSEAGPLPGLGFRVRVTVPLGLT